MRIAVYHNLPSGGAKRALYEIVRLLNQKHIFDVHTLSSAAIGYQCLRHFCKEFTVYPFKPFPLASSPFGRLNQGIRTVDLIRLQVLQKRIAHQIDAGHYDVVFVNHCQYTQSPGILQFLKTPTVYFCHEPPRVIYEPAMLRPYTKLSTFQRIVNCFDPLPVIYKTILANLDKHNARSASLVLANSAYSRDVLFQIYGVHSQVCYLGVDIIKFQPINIPKENIVLSVGALTPYKGFDFLIKSLSLISDDKRPLLVIVSNFVDERERDFIEWLASKEGVRIEIKAAIQDEELVKLYNQARLVLYCPIKEPFGLVPLESMACSTPVVGVEEGGVGETVLHEKTGLLTERDPLSFAQATMLLLSDKDLCTKYGRQGRLFVESNWQWDRLLQIPEEYLAHAAQRGN